MTSYRVGSVRVTRANLENGRMGRFFDEHPEGRLILVKQDNEPEGHVTPDQVPNLVQALKLLVGETARPNP